VESPTPNLRNQHLTRGLPHRNSAGLLLQSLRTAAGCPLFGGGKLMTGNLLRRLDALRQMTEERGCTKAEAATAASLAAKLASICARRRSELSPAPPNPFATYLACTASMAAMQAALYAAAAQHWAAIAQIYRYQRAGDLSNARPCDTGGPDTA
jgi:hypothetical protein